jgi:hypothetical protein
VEEATRTALLLVVGALAVAWVMTEAAPTTHLVRVSTNAGELCGEFVSADRDEVAVRTEGHDVVVPRERVVSVLPAGACGAAP